MPELTESTRRAIRSVTSRGGTRARRWIAVLLVLGLLPFAASTTNAPPADAARTVLFGAAVKPRSGQSQQQAVQSLESKLGVRLDAYREFRLWDDSYPNRFQRWLLDTNHTLLLSVKAQRRNGQKIPWRAIADARPGSQLHNEMTAWADRIKATGKRTYFIFHHEPEASTNTAHGGATEFKAAWRKIVDVFRARGVWNAEFLWTMTSWSFATKSSDARYADKWYPGDSYVHHIGGDPYNWYTCRDSRASWTSLRKVIEPMRRFGARHPGKGLFMPEWASTEDGARAGRKAAWIDEARSLFKQSGYEQFRGITWYDSNDGRPACKWWVDSSSSAFDGFKRMSRDPFYGG